MLKITGMRDTVSSYHNMKNITFRRVSCKSIKNVSMGMLFASILSLSACANKEQKDTVEISSNTINNINVSDKQKQSAEKKAIKSYHYFPSNKEEVDPEDYVWTETKYPDGSIKKDSLGHIVTISPEGERTDEYSEVNDNGFLVNYRILPDGSRVVRTNYSPKGDDCIVYTENTFRPDSTIKEIFFHNEYKPDSTFLYTDKIIEESRHIYNENGVLLKWETNIIDPERNESFNKYDSKNRLIYDDMKNEKFEYNGNSKVPYRSVSLNDGCKRITLYNDSGVVSKIYFEASDGTVTE